MGTKLKKGETKKGMGPAGGAPVNEKTGKVFTGQKGTKRSVGPAGAPVSEKTGKVFTGKEDDLPQKKAGGGLAEATAKLKAKGFEDGGMVVKDKIVAIDKSPNSGLITVKGFGAGRRT